MKALGYILHHETFGQRARYERFIADLLFVMASGNHIDESKSKRFGDIVDQVYKNPYAKAPKEMTAEEIKQYIVQRLEDL